MAIDETISKGDFKNGDYHLEMDNGDLVLTVMYDGEGFNGDVRLILDPEYFLDQLKQAIPGKIDDSIIELIKGAFFEGDADGPSGSDA